MSLMSTLVKRSSYLSLKGFSLNAFMLMINNQETKKINEISQLTKPVQNQ